MQKYNIPTANFKIFENFEDTKEFLNTAKFPLVIKADGLAAGKGVYICKNIKDGVVAAEEIFGGKFGIAKSLLIEDFLIGEEMSYFVICDGKNYQFLGTAQDHKRVGEGDVEEYWRYGMLLHQDYLIKSQLKKINENYKSNFKSD